MNWEGRTNFEELYDRLKASLDDSDKFKAEIRAQEGLDLAAQANKLPQLVDGFALRCIFLIEERSESWDVLFSNLSVALFAWAYAYSDDTRFLPAFHNFDFNIDHERVYNSIDAISWGYTCFWQLDGEVERCFESARNLSKKDERLEWLFDLVNRPFVAPF